MMELLIQDVNDGKVFDITDLATELKWETTIDFQPSKFEFTMVLDEQVKCNYGDIIRFKVDDKGIFYGKLFKKKRSSKKQWKITAYDQMRYLKNSDTIVFEASKSNEIFAQICEINHLEYKVVDEGNWTCPEKIEDKKTYFAMIQNALDLTLIHGGMWYIIRDNFGTLEHISLNSLVTDLVIGDDSVATDYDFEGSIDDSYNYVKLTKDNKKTKKREVYVVQDSKNVGLWGKLQFHEKVDEKMNESQIQQKAEMLLKAKNFPKKTFKVPCLGHIGISAGNSVQLDFKGLESEGIEKNSLAIVKKCTHKWGKVHTMELELRTVNS